MDLIPIGPLAHLHVFMIMDMVMDPSPPPVCVQSALRHGADPEHHGSRRVGETQPSAGIFLRGLDHGAL